MNTNEIKTYRLIIKGKVQEVGFRHWFSDLAISLGLNGYIQNKAPISFLHTQCITNLRI